MPGRLRIAFAGAGMVADLHHRAIQRSRDAELVGFFTPSPERRTRRAAEWGVTAYPTIGDLVADDRVEAVFVLANLEGHEPFASAALASGRPVLVEKPVGDPQAIRGLIKAAEAADRLCMPAHNYAYVPEFVQLRELVREGALGRVRAAWVTYAIQHPESVAASYPGVLDQIMVHHGYLAVALFGAPDQIVAGISRPGWERLTQEDQAWMVWRYDGGPDVQLFASFAVGDDTADPWSFVVKVLGTDGGAGYSWRSGYLRRPVGSLSFGLPSYEDSYRHELGAFVRAVRGEPEAVMSTMDDALTVAESLAIGRADAVARGPR